MSEVCYPLKFEPIPKQRVWGGRNLEKLFGKALPSPEPYGESWEITDRPEGVSRVVNGKWKGRDLRWLMENHGEEVMGAPVEPGQRFPLLVKILDARDKLSLQVHPPEPIASLLKGEPKTEMWFITHAEEGSMLYVGLKKGLSKEEFVRKCDEGTVADCFHKIQVRPGDAMFLPSGRVHAIGAGNVLFEIQQNSDTTYRVFDWNRKGLDGRPRDLHLKESLDSIDFEDFEPGLIDPEIQENGAWTIKKLVNHALFNVDQLLVRESAELDLNSAGSPTVLGVVRGRLRVVTSGGECDIATGEFCLVPGWCRGIRLISDQETCLLRSQPKSGKSGA